MQYLSWFWFEATAVTPETIARTTSMPSAAFLNQTDDFALLRALAESERFRTHKKLVRDLDAVFLGESDTGIANAEFRPGPVVKTA